MQKRRQLLKGLCRSPWQFRIQGGGAYEGMLTKKETRRTGSNPVKSRNGTSLLSEKNFPVSLSELQTESEKLNFANKSQDVCKVCIKL